MNRSKTQYAETSTMPPKTTDLTRHPGIGIGEILCWACILTCAVLLILLSYKLSIAMDFSSKVFSYVFVALNDNNSQVMSSGLFISAAVSGFWGLRVLFGLCLSTLFYLPADASASGGHTCVKQWSRTGHMYLHPRPFFKS
jgi:hypothetical protein